MSPDFVDFMVRSAGSGLWGGNPPTDPKVLGSVGGNPLSTVGLVSSGGGGLVSSGFDKFRGVNVRPNPRTRYKPNMGFCGLGLGLSGFRS